jgi:hypothetical protein
LPIPEWLVPHPAGRVQGWPFRFIAPQ